MPTSYDDEADPPKALALSHGTAAGLGALLIGCSLFVATVGVMVFNVILFRGPLGMGGGELLLARAGGVVAVFVGGALGVFAIVTASGGRRAAREAGESAALPTCGLAAAWAGTFGWLASTADSLAVLRMFG